MTWRALSVRPSDEEDREDDREGEEEEEQEEEDLLDSEDLESDRGLLDRMGVASGYSYFPAGAGGARGYDRGRGLTYIARHVIHVILHPRFSSQMEQKR